MARRIRRIALSLALAAATTIAVAWTLAVRVTVPVFDKSLVRAEGRYHDKRGNSYWCWVGERLGVTFVVWAPTLDNAPGLDLSTALDDRGVARRRAVIGSKTIPRWAQRTMLVPNRRPVGAIARGWPMRALWCEEVVISRPPTVRGGIVLPQGLDGLGPGRVLPCRPTAPGFAVDSLLYAALWYAALACLAAVRRAWRCRRGLCPRCGYDLAHGRQEHCPECGFSPGSAQSPGTMPGD